MIFNLRLYVLKYCALYRMQRSDGARAQRRKKTYSPMLRRSSSPLPVLDQLSALLPSKP